MIHQFKNQKDMLMEMRIIERNDKCLIAFYDMRYDEKICDYNLETFLTHNKKFTGCGVALWGDESDLDLSFEDLTNCLNFINKFFRDRNKKLQEELAHKFGNK